MGKHKIIDLVYGSEEGCEWRFRLIYSAKQHISGFYIADETRNYRNRVRSKDRAWAREMFPRLWRQQYEIHHSWMHNETLHFLTPAEHYNLHHGLC